MKLSPRLISVLALGVISGLGSAISGCGTHDSFTPPRSEGHRLLVEALGNTRWLEPRLSGGFAFAPCRSLPREEGQLFSRPQCSPPLERDSAAYHRLVKAGGVIEKESRKDVQGIWHLVWARSPEAVERAVSALEEAVEEAPDDASLRSDLGAAYLVRARIQEKPYDLILALDNVEKALLFEDALPEALFNRMLIFKEMGLSTADPWDGHEYGIESSSQGRDWDTVGKPNHGKKPESSEDLEALLRALTQGDSSKVAAAVRLAPSFFRREALEELFPRLADQWIEEGEKEASNALEVLRSLGEELAQVTGDRSVIDTVQTLDAQRDHSGRLRLSLEAVRAFGEGRRLFRESRYEEAISRFEAVLSDSPGSGNPLALWADFWLAAIDTTMGDYSGALARTQKIRRIHSLGSFPALRARLRWNQALVELRTGYFRASLENYERASALYAQMGEKSLEGAALALAAESYRALGRHDEAWGLRLRAFRRLGDSPSGYLHNLYLDAASACEERGAPLAALALQSLGVENAAAMGSASRETEAFLWRGKLLGHSRPRREVLADLDAASSRLRSVADESLRKRLTADLSEARGRALLPENPAEAIIALTETVDLYRSIKYRFRLPAVYLARARGELALGNIGRAEEDLLAGIREYERRDDHLGQHVFRYSHFERAQELYDELIRLSLDREAPRQALAYAERARLSARRRVDDATRLFRGESSPEEPEGQSQDLLDDWMGRLPEGVVVVEYAVLADRLVIWRISRDSFDWWWQEIVGAKLSERVREFSALLAQGGDARRMNTLATGLHRDLLAPVVEGLHRETHLVIVPDRALAKVPFMALRDGETGRYLIEDFVVSHSLGLSALVGGEESSPKRVRKSLRGSSVTLAGYAESPEDGLADLPGVRAEIDRLSLLLPEARSLSGAAVKREAILEALERAEIFHFAGHGVSDDARPWASYLPIAPDENGEAGRLYAHELSGKAMKNLQLVVLSSCESAGTTEARTTAVSGLSLAFLRAGVPSVMVNLWEVEDGTGPRFREFYEELGKGVSVPAALRTAILTDGAVFRESGDRAPWMVMVPYVQRIN